MGSLINLFVTVPQSIWNFVDGSKTYIAGSISILTGIAGVAQEILGPLSAHDMGSVYTVVKHLPQDQSWLLIVAGLGTVGLRHSVAKATTQ